MSVQQPDNTQADQHDIGEEHSEELPEQMRIRREKRDALIAAGMDPYPVSAQPSVALSELRAKFDDLPADHATGEQVTVVGRVIFLRNTGKLCFARLRDGDGAELQAMVSLDRVGRELLDNWKAFVDIGDQVGVSGEVITSRRGELSVSADRWFMVAKALRPLPVEHKPLSDEARVRMRYVDLIVRPEARTVLRARIETVASLRRTLAERGFLEVETPMLQSVHGGAAAPFVTHHNALDRDFYLRTNLELALKRLIVGGVHRVFELDRVFRNEGIDATHSPEFSELEAYQAFADYRTMAELDRDLVLNAAEAVGSTVVPDGHGGEVDLDVEWRWLPIHQAVSEILGEELTPDTDQAVLRGLAERNQLDPKPDASAAELLLLLFEKLVEHTIVAPTFICDYPVEVRPLARKHRDDPRLAEAFDLIIAGVELSPAYSELNDPVDQRERLVAQAVKAAGGDTDAMELDEDFLRALEYGMPPTGGMGMGIDRLVMLLTGVRSLRETILFPLVKPEG